MFVLETDSPIAAAEVTVFDVSGVSELQRRDGGALSEREVPLVRKGISLGSSRTDYTGEFEIAISEKEPGIERQLVVIAVAERQSKTKASSRILHVSPSILRSIGDYEEFSIGVPAASIAPISSDSGAALTKTASAAYGAKTASRKAVRTALRESIDTRRTEFADTRAKVDKALRDRAKKRFQRANGRLAVNYVTESSNVKATQKKTIKSNLSSFGRLRVFAQIDPDKTGRDQLVDSSDAVVAGLTSNKIRDMIFDASRHPMASDWAFYDALSTDCRKRSLIRQFDESDQQGGSTTTNNPPPGQDTEASVQDVKKHLKNLLDEIKEAGDRAKSGEESGSLAGINGFVHGLDIQGGAADQTAVFDFERLNFAFEHVWEDIFDPWWSTVVAGSIIDVDRVIKANTNAPNPPPNRPRRDLLEELQFQTNNIRAATRAELSGDDSQVVTYSLLGGLKSIGGAVGGVVGGVAGVAGGIIDIVGGGGGGGSGSRDYRDRGDGRGRVRDHRGKGRGRQGRERGKRMKILEEYLSALDDAISSDYPFTVFGADDSGRAINYGQLVRYRQRWEPKSYQAGELVKTLPLAPKQKIAFSTKRVTKKTYTEKRAEASENTYNSSDSSTARDVAKIVNNAKLETSYTMENKANASVPGVGGGESKSTFQTNFGIQSTRTKESFREQTRKESESFKNSTSVQIETTESEEFIEETSGEITNPNDEIAFTCLFYELQRRYEVSERLHRLTPVILVAEDVWRPSDITPELIARYDWVIRRVLLDESYEGALKIISAGTLVAEQAGLVDLEDMMEEQFDVVDSLKKQLQSLDYTSPGSSRRRRRSVLEAALGMFGIGSGGGGSQGAQGVLDEEEQRENELEDELRRQEGLLAQAVDRFNEAFTSFATQIIQVKKLQLHIKENVIYYMQAVWDHEDRHQMLMRLRNTQVPEISGQVRYSVSGVADAEEPPNWNKPIKIVGRPFNFDVEDDTLDLAEVADLSRPLGFFGNYRIFPLTTLNPVSELLTVPFLSGKAGISDPDWVGNYTVSDLEHYAECLRSNLSVGDFTAVKPKLLDALKRRLDNARPDAEEIVIPTGSLFIELLPGAHSVLENFKRQHRAIDVADALADVITKRLDHLRVSARIADDKLGDPNVEKVVIAEADQVDLNDI
jgi:hypothetical protein